MEDKSVDLLLSSGI